MCENLKSTFYIDRTNYIALKALEKLRVNNPDQEEINIMEAILALAIEPAYILSSEIPCNKLSNFENLLGNSLLEEKK